MGQVWGPCGVVFPGQAMREELGLPVHPSVHPSRFTVLRGGGVTNG